MAVFGFFLWVITLMSLYIFTPRGGNNINFILVNLMNTLMNVVGHFSTKGINIYLTYIQQHSFFYFLERKKVRTVWNFLALHI